MGKFGITAGDNLFTHCDTTVEVTKAEFQVIRQDFDLFHVSIEVEVSGLAIRLHPIHPNPFDPVTNIRYDVTTSTVIKIGVWNLKEQQIKVLVDEIIPAGSHQTIWDSMDDAGRPVSSGIYFYRLTSGKRRSGRWALT